MCKELSRPQMNMHSFKLLVVTLILLLGSCKRETHVTFGVEEANLYEDKALKTKSKNEAVYISVLYTNLYQTPISPSQLYKTQAVIYSIGDRNVANEMVLSNYFNTQGLTIPSNAEMRADIESFVVETYKRFFLRYPSEGEKTWMIQYITRNSQLSVEMIYTGFAASDEYQYY